MKKNYEQNLDYKKLYESFKEAYNNSCLKEEKVSLPGINTDKAVDLVYCYSKLGQIYREEEMRAYYTSITGKTTWRQPRHYGTQFGWNHFIVGEVLPNGYKLKNGEFCLWDINHCKKGYNPERRSKDPITAKEFIELKKKYGYRCAVCKDLEGTPSHLYPDKIVKLQKGHINPNKPLTVSNCIPQCQCCNQGAENHWIFNKAGEIYAPNTVEAVMRNKNDGFRESLLNELLIWKKSLKAS